MINVPVPSEIISIEELGAPNFYQDLMNILSKGNIINKEQADKMNKLISKRNIFAHFYGDITEKEVLDTAIELKEVDRSLKAIKKRSMDKG